MNVEYTIEISYATGDSFHNEDRVSELGVTWKNLERAQESLEHIKNHYEYCKKNYDQWSKPNGELPVGVEWNDKYRMILLMLVDDNGKPFHYSDFWTGYFETLYEAKIIAVEKSLGFYKPYY